MDYLNKSDIIRAINKLEDMISEMAGELRQDYQLYSSAEGADDLLSQIKQYIDCCDKPIYKIHTFEIFKGRLHSHEMFGWYHDLESATLAVENNECNMQAHEFNYAMISRSYEGCYGLRDMDLQWYTWNYTDHKWEKCECPEACNKQIFA